ncbi:hypothetical protein LguiB_012633 [Lonicera macranthoides]
MEETLPLAVAKGIVSKVLSFASEVVTLASVCQGDLESLALKLERVRALLCDAESKQPPLGMVESWLRKVKVAACDAEVVFDKFNYEFLRQEIEVKGGIKSKGGDVSEENGGDADDIQPIELQGWPRLNSLPQQLQHRIPSGSRFGLNVTYFRVSILMNPNDHQIELLP